MLKLLKKKFKNKKAFTLIEVVVAISLVSVGMIGVLSLMTQNIIAQNVNKNNLIASMLAQESVELVREIRDTNWSNGVPFETGIPTTFTADYTGIKSTGILSIDNDLTNIVIDSNGFYSHNIIDPNTNKTIFKRLINVSLNPAKTLLEVKSTVRWTKGNKNSDYVAETILYDWH